ncbi:MAG TPA: amino acid adenylation domain-containing protein, partial [Longimicrobium sp.]
MQDLHSRRDDLSSAKRALLEQRLRGRGGARPQETIGRCAGDGPDFPMSFAQERMWFLAQFEPGNPMYNVPVALLVRTDIDVPRLERALREVVTRHESLRTVYRMVDGELRQVVEDPYDVTVEVLDVRDRVRTADPMEDIRRLISEEGARVFDVSRLPLFRVTLLRVSDERFAMVITTHHIATDGWSMPIIIRDMDEIYTAYTVGRPVALREPAIRYADYSVWQRQYLTGATLEKQVGYWRGLLAGAPTLELPTDRPRPAQQSFRGAFYRFNIAAETSQRLRDVCRQEGVTVNMVVLAAFNVLLHRWSEQDDLVVGTLLGNRTRAELEEVLGYFVNTAALRIDVSGDPPFSEVVRRARNSVLDADAHQELPFERLIDVLGLERDLSRHPIFQVMYFHHVFVGSHNSPTDGMVSSLDPRPIYEENTISLVDTGVAKFDLMLATMESPVGLMAVFEYATDLFDVATVQRMAEHLELVLEQATAAPDQPISRISLVDDAELRRLTEWNEASRRDHPFAAIPELFERQVAANPNAPAIWFRGETVSYGELNSRANRIARRLRAAGVGMESIVGVCLERTPDLIATLLAVHKAGGAYTPLQPSYPAARIAAIVADAEPLVVVATSESAEVLPANQRVLLLDRDAAEIAAEDDGDLRVPTDPRQLAYVIYTSGSTGTPKGVQVEHFGVSALLHWLREAVPDEERASTLASTPVVFDVSVGELFGTICWGGRLVLVDNAIDLAALPESVGVKLALVVPTAAGELARMGTVPASVTAFNLCGEAVSATLAADLHALPGVSTVRNIYGPTEATVYATAAPVLPGDPSPSIGRPVHDTRAYVLDRRFHLLAPGLPGELFLGGAGVARGYANRAALTAERFVPDPLGAPGSRMYRTGDRARFRPDGDLAYLGRMDTQVKVRGHRVELGEIEVVLLRHPAVHDAVVAARNDVGAGHTRLVAYIVPALGVAAPPAAELRAHLRERLPDYMVPSAFVVLDALPAGPSGKVDRAALPVPDAGSMPAAAATAWVDPAGGVESTLASVWAAVLRRERVGARDNFFELGGDSILAIQVVTRAAEHGIRLSPRQMFQHQTVAEQAAVAGAAAATHAEQGPVVGDAPLTPVQRWFFEQDLP